MKSFSFIHLRCWKMKLDRKEQRKAERQEKSDIYYEY